MKRTHLLSILAGIALVLSALFLTGRATASTGCFSDTNGHWAETFICWLKDNGVSSGYPDGTFRPGNNITRAEVAVLVQKSANVPPASGNILVSSGFSNWTKFYSTDPINYSNYANGSYLRSSSAGTYTLLNQPEVPVVLYGKSLELVGVEICYESATGNYLSEVRLRTYAHTNSLASSNLRFTDATDRTDTACRYYVITTPVVMNGEMGVEVYLDVTWTSASTDFGFGRTTYVLRPTTTTAPDLLGLDTQDARQLDGGTVQEDVSPEIRP